MTYWALNAVFLGAVAVVAALAIVRERRAGVAWPAVCITAALLLAMTALFDNIMIGVGLVGYDESLISGAFVGLAPLEDFAYAVAAVVLLPSLWALLPVTPGSASARPDSAPAPSGADS